MTDFINFAFPATGSTANRTMPARLRDVTNVLEFNGIDRTGALDCTAAVQAAINAAAQSGFSGNITKGGIVFFPPGQYRVNGTLTNSTNGVCSVQLVGSGKDTTMIFGTNNSGFLIVGGVNTFEEISGIEGLTIQNNSTTAGTGAVLLQLLGCAKVRGCRFKGMYCMRYDNNTFNSTVEECEFIGPTTYNAASVGLSTSQIGIYNCLFQNLGVGLRGYNGGTIVSCCRFENCGVGWAMGIFWDGSSSAIISTGGVAVKFNNCDTAIDMAAGVNACSLMAVNITGTTGANGTGKPQYGLKITDGQDLSIFGLRVTAECAVAGIWIGNYNAAFYECNSTVSPGTGVNWQYPAHSGQWFLMRFERCNNPAFILHFADLFGASGYEGQERSIDDCNTTTWGATAAGGGSNHVKVRSNGTNWTVMA